MNTSEGTNELIIALFFAAGDEAQLHGLRANLQPLGDFWTSGFSISLSQMRANVSHLHLDLSATTALPARPRIAATHEFGSLSDRQPSESDLEASPVENDDDGSDWSTVSSTNEEEQEAGAEVERECDHDHWTDDE